MSLLITIELILLCRNVGNEAGDGIDEAGDGPFKGLDIDVWSINLMIYKIME